MKDMADALHGIAHGGSIAEVALNKLDLFLKTGQVFEMAGGKVVKHPDTLPLRGQPPRQIGADETGTAGDQVQIAHRTPQPPSALANPGKARGQIRNQTV